MVKNMTIVSNAYILTGTIYLSKYMYTDKDKDKDMDMDMDMDKYGFSFRLPASGFR